MIHILARLTRAGVAIAMGWLAPAASAQARSDAEFVAPRPAWVDEVVPPAPRPERMSSVDQGSYFLVVDVQVRLRDGETWTYRRTVEQITSRAGLESAAKLSYAYDPTRETLAFHGARILRDGAVIDRLPDLTFETARQEPRLDSGIVDGDITVFSQIGDVRVGDVVDIEMSWTTRDPLWTDGHSTAGSLRWSAPVGLSRFRLLAPGDLDVSVRNHGLELEPTTAVIGEEIERIWAVEDGDPILGEDNTPAHHPTWGYVEVSTAQSWVEVADWAVGVFDVDPTLPQTARAKIEAIRAETADPYRQATLALRYVQDTIRYVGDEVGLGSHVPRSPSEVIARAWGDCKDVSLLLAAMLRELGVEAYPALTDLDRGGGLPNVLPSPYAFDHAITLAILDGEAYWLDATRTHQGGVLPGLAQPNYGYALPVRPGQAELEPIMLREPEGPGITMEEIFDFNGGEGVELIVRTRYAGRDADNFRFRLDSEGRNGVLQQFLDYYQRLYPGLERNGDATVEDRFEDNVIELEERYRLSADAFVSDGLNEQFPMRADAVLGLVPQVTAPVRETPLALPYPASRRHVIELRNAPTRLIASDPYEAADAHLRFTMRQEETTDGLRAEFEVETFAPVAASSDAARVSEISGEIDDRSDLIINLTPPEGLGWLAGATQGWTAEQVQIAVVVAIFSAFGLAIVVGCWWSLRADMALGDRVFHPVGLIKFAILSVATFGIYAAFWMWRCWRWVKTDQPRPMWPFARALFSGFYYYALFDEIRRRASGSDALTLVGVLLAILYIGSNVVTALLDRLEIAPVLSLAISIAGILLVLPLVWGVNRLNRGHPEALARNSRWGVRSVLALLFGAAFWALAITGLTTEVAV